MKILLVSPLYPHRRAGGFALRTFAILRELARRNEVHLLVLQAPELSEAPTADDEATIRPWVRSLDVVERPGQEPAGWSTRVRLLLRKTPPGAAVFLGESVVRAFDRAIETHRPDLVLFESIFPSVLLDRVPDGIQVVIDEHNVEYLLLKRAGKPDGLHLGKQMSYEAHWRLLKGFEKRQLRKADLVLTTSEVDRRKLQPLARDVEMVEIPNGVDVPEALASLEDGHPKLLIFTGLMSYPPNEKAVLWFTRDILPHIVARDPEVRFVIAGAKPSTRVAELASDERITVTGAVPDMGEEIRRAGVFVVPLLQGSGTRLKILEAWSHGRPVVSTSLGCEGLSIRPGEDVVLANREEDFAHRVLELISNPGLRAHLARHGFETARNRYSWASIGERLRTSFQRCFEPKDDRANEANDRSW